MKEVTVVIPVREGGDPDITLRSLANQDFKDFDIIISQDCKNNANWARNRGVELVKTSLVLLSDDDITWLPNSLTTLYNASKQEPHASFFYGGYTMDGQVYCNT